MFSLEEKPNKLFLNLENNNDISKTLKDLKETIMIADTKMTNPKEILEEIRLFYQNLYSFKKITKI